MIRKTAYYLVTAAVIAVALESSLFAARLAPTRIYVEGIHCGHCAKRLAAKLYTVKGVAGVKASVQKGVAYVTPQQSKSPSPRALWEAVEAAEMTPLKIVDPRGTFTKKPRS